MTKAKADQAPKQCLHCHKKIDDKSRLSRRKFCSPQCRYAWHGAQRHRDDGESIGAANLAEHGPLVQAIWTDLYAVFEKYGMTPRIAAKETTAEQHTAFNRDGRQVTVTIPTE